MLHRQPKLTAGPVVPCGERHAAARPGAAHGVHDDVPQRLAQAALVGADGWHGGRAVDHKGHLGRGSRRIGLAEARTEQLADVHLLLGQVEAAAFETRNVENGVDEAEQRPARAVGDAVALQVELGGERVARRRSPAHQGWSWRRLGEKRAPGRPRRSAASRRSRMVAFMISTQRGPQLGAHGGQEGGLRRVRGLGGLLGKAQRLLSFPRSRSRRCRW